MRTTDLLDTPSVRMMDTKVERRIKQDQARAIAEKGRLEPVSTEKLARIGLLLNNTTQSAIVNLIGVLVYFSVSAPYMPLNPLLYWCATMVVLTLTRFLLNRYFQSDVTDKGRLRWLSVYTVGTTLSGAGWAAGLVLGLSVPQVEMHTICAFMLAGVVASTLPIISAMPAVFVSYMVVLGLPIAIMCLSPWYSGPPTTALMATVFMCVFTNVGLHYSKTLARAILSDQDSLTKLLNRRAFDRSLNLFLSQNTLDADGGVLCYLDIDRFKTINDTYGHAAGDLLICEVAKIMEKTVRRDDVLARFGGDEFAILLRSHSLQDGKQVAERIRESIENYSARWEGRRIATTVSMGVVVIKPGATSVQAITTAADTALYTAKHLGRNRVHFHDPDDELERQRRDEIAWIRRLREGFIDRRLRLAMQQIHAVDQQSGVSKKRYEILLRLITANHDVISAGKFMSAAERYGLTPILDRWVIDQTVRWLAQNPDACQEIEWCAINVSHISLADERFELRIRKIFKKYNVSPEKICFEISETTVLHNRALVKKFCDTFRPLGCRFSIDGCGRAFDVLDYLKDVGADLLKIDGHFVSNLLKDKQAESIVQAINDIGQGHGMHTVAGFVENKQTLQRIQSLGINYAQGFGLDRPVILEINSDGDSDSGTEEAA